MGNSRFPFGHGTVCNPQLFCKNSLGEALLFSAGCNELPDFLLIHAEASPFWLSFYHGKEALHTNQR